MPDKSETITIVVNGTEHDWSKGTISYAEVVTLDVPDYAQHTDRTYSVKYTKGQSGKQEGILAPGASIRVKDEMVFTVDDTGQS